MKPSLVYQLWVRTWAYMIHHLWRDEWWYQKFRRYGRPCHINARKIPATFDVYHPTHTIKSNKSENNPSCTNWARKCLEMAISIEYLHGYGSSVHSKKIPIFESIDLKHHPPTFCVHRTRSQSKRPWPRKIPHPEPQNGQDLQGVCWVEPFDTGEDVSCNEDLCITVYKSRIDWMISGFTPISLWGAKTVLAVDIAMHSYANLKTKLYRKYQKVIRDTVYCLCYIHIFVQPHESSVLLAHTGITNNLSQHIKLY